MKYKILEKVTLRSVLNDRNKFKSRNIKGKWHKFGELNYMYGEISFEKQLVSF